MAPSLCLIVLSLIAIGGLTAWSRAIETHQLFERKVELSSRLSQFGAAQGVWLVDEGVLRQALAPILADPDQDLVLVRDTRASPLFISGDRRLEALAQRTFLKVGSASSTATATNGTYLLSRVPLAHDEDGVVTPLGDLIIVYNMHSVTVAAWSSILWVSEIGVCTIALIIALLVGLLRRITWPLAGLSATMSRLAAGELKVPVAELDRGDEIGTMARAIQVFKDNALQLKQSELERERLLEAKVRAESANSAKREFLAHMSHELRTPLNGVVTMANLMAEDALEPEQRRRLDIIRESGLDLLHVINDILDFSKIEAGKLELEDVEFDVEHTLRSAIATFSAVAQRKDLTLTIDIDRNAKGRRRGDPTRLRQILNNYVSNALKFTSEGGVAVRVSGLGDKGHDGLIIAVHDTGLGIAPDKTPFLFQSFTQVDSSTTRKFGGTGLGLAICKELASLMGGRAWAESVPGEGSIFYAEIKAAYVGEAIAMTKPQLAPSSPKRNSGELNILAAEDNLTNQVVLSSLIQAFGFKLQVVSNGQLALEAWRAGAFDIILMDVQMPLMDGLEATQLIRAEEAEGGLERVPIIALTANAFAHQIEGYLAAGMDGHLAKPIEIPMLYAVLEGVLTKRQALDL